MNQREALQLKTLNCHEENLNKHHFSFFVMTECINNLALNVLMSVIALELYKYVVLFWSCLISCVLTRSYSILFLQVSETLIKKKNSNEQQFETEHLERPKWYATSLLSKRTDEFNILAVFSCEEDIKQELKMAQGPLFLSCDKDCNKWWNYRINLILL